MIPLYITKTTHLKKGEKSVLFPIDLPPTKYKNEGINYKYRQSMDDIN